MVVPYQIHGFFLVRDYIFPLCNLPTSVLESFFIEFPHYRVSSLAECLKKLEKALGIRTFSKYSISIGLPNEVDLCT